MFVLYIVVLCGVLLFVFHFQIAFTECKDHNPFCPDWASVYCDKKSSNYNYMNNTCQKSCGCPNFPKDEGIGIIYFKFIDVMIVTCYVTGGTVDGTWKTIGESKQICNHATQQIFVSTENQCKNWCSSKKLTFCFWDITENDNFCFGTSACVYIKSVAVAYRRFDKSA